MSAVSEKVGWALVDQSEQCRNQSQSINQLINQSWWQRRASATQSNNSTFVFKVKVEWKGRPRPGQHWQVTATWPNSQTPGFSLSHVPISPCFLILYLFLLWELSDMWPVCHLARRLCMADVAE